MNAPLGGLPATELMPEETRTTLSWAAAQAVEHAADQRETGPPIIQPAQKSKGGR